MLSKEQILGQISRRTKDIPSEVFGGDLRIRELARVEWRSAARASDRNDPNETERLTQFRGSMSAWLQLYQEQIPDEAREDLAGRVERVAQTSIDVDIWNSSIFAAGVIGDDGQPLFTAEEVRGWPNRDDVWAEVIRIGGEILALSEVGPASLKSGDLPPDQE